MSEAKFIPLLAAAFGGLAERPARVFFGLLVLLWTLLLSALVIAPVAALCIFLLRSPMLMVPLCVVIGIGLVLYLGGRSYYTLQRLYATDDSFFEAWAESAPNRSRTVVGAGLTFILVALGAVCLIVPGVVAYLGLCLVPPLLVLEGHAGGETLRTSWRMMDGWKLRVFLWTAVFFIGSFGIRLLLGVVPILGPLLNFALSLFVFTPLSSLFYIELYRSLKANPQPRPVQWGTLALAALAGLVLLAAAGFWAYQERAKFLPLLMKRGLGQATAPAVLTVDLAAEGESLADQWSNTFAPLAPQAPFTSAWSGVRPGLVAVGLSGTVVVADSLGSLQSYDYNMAPLLSRTCEVNPLLGIAASASGEFYVLGSPSNALQPLTERLGPDLSAAFSWSVSADGFPRPQGGVLAAQGTNLWRVTAGLHKTVALYDLNGQVLKQGRWTDKDPGLVFGVSLAADQVGGLYLLADCIDVGASPHAVYRRLSFDSVPDDPAADSHCAWDVALPVQAGDGYGLVSVSWDGVPYVADRHGLSAVPGGAVAHAWPYDLGVPLRGFAIDPWGVAHFLDGQGRMQRMASVAY